MRRWLKYPAIILLTGCLAFGHRETPLLPTLLTEIRKSHDLPVPTALFGTWCRAGFDPAAIKPAEAATKLTIPVFIGHGRQDDFIPPDNARRIHDAVPHERKPMRIVPDGTHGNVLAKGGNAFYADIAGFFLTHLPTPLAHL